MALTNVSLKLLVDTQCHRVLFAEANKDFVDFLFYILSLPVGTVIRLLAKDGMVGCLGNLYDSIATLNDSYLQPNQNKDSILKPKAPDSNVNVPLLMLPNGESSTSKKIYKCPNYQRNPEFNSTFGVHENKFHNCRVYVADDPRSKCPQCKNLMSFPAVYVVSKVENIISSSEEGGFVKGVITYMVMDDLVVKPMSTISSIAMLNKFNIKEVGVLEERVVNVGMDEGLKLLKASLQSKTTLTDVFLQQERPM
ncbi:DUF674 domain-containing protein [Cephalotus follicularis]|uniref:DUF674 domain-containing protein n=1 Tax=Cephalotus follicularis TaxID=3775 RepID=A0A1Q3C7I4_CEPFO|nr:DUF674 domain-containing protein [Cephalotus follicularis]